MKVVKDKLPESQKEFDNRMTKFEVREQQAECEVILAQTEANLKSLALVKAAMINRLEQLKTVEIVRLTKRQRSRRDVHNQEVRALKSLRGVMNDKAKKLGNEQK